MEASDSMDYSDGSISGSPFNKQANDLQEENVCPVVYVGSFFNEIRLGEPVEKVMNEIAKCIEEAGNAPFVHNGINPMDYDSVKNDPT